MCRYSELIGKYREDDIQKFFARVVKKKIQMKKLSEHLQFKDRNCEEFHENLGKGSAREEDDKIL